MQFGSGELTAVVLERLVTGESLVEFSWEQELPFPALLERLGVVPLPPYIKEPLPNAERYQTVYGTEAGSAAAPTAGLHFTNQLLAELQEQGVEMVSITLQIGLGTFRPVQVDEVSKHAMHAEDFQVSAEAAQAINQARQERRRVIAVGTTSCRVLESAADADGWLRPFTGPTDLFITPGYKFKATDGLITNFHLPKSTLLMMVSAMVGRSEILSIYEEAVRRRFRFYSLGDAMLIGEFAP